MQIGILTIGLFLPEAQSLKDKRQVLESLIATSRRKFNISIAEIADMDRHHQATLGVACVANNRRYVNQVLDNVVNEFENCLTAEVSTIEMEFL